jgi:histidyl-tRNA synthetase
MVPVLRSLDKLPKIGRDQVAREIVEKASISVQSVDLLLEKILTMTGMSGSCSNILERLKNDLGHNAKAREGIGRLQEMFGVLQMAGLDENYLRLDLSIARGLDYYTGTVFETFLTELPGIGSVCSGGRYDNLAGLYTRQPLPGVGASLGLDRLLSAMDSLGSLRAAESPAPVLIVQFSSEYLGKYESIARALRNAGIGAEVFCDAKKIGQQLQYAERRGFRVALIGGSDEIAKGIWKVKDLRRRQEAVYPEKDVITAVRQNLQ